MIAQRLFSSAYSFVCLLTLFVMAPAVGAQPGEARTAVPRPASPPGAGSVKNGASGSLRPTSLTGTLSADAARSLSGAATELPTGISSSSVQAAPRHRPLGIGIYVPLAVIDAPAYGRGGSTLEITPLSSDVVIAPSFYPTMQPPVWRIVAEEHPVQGWRIVDVTDTVCDASGGCAPVTTRMLARWAPSLRAYAFRDRVGRIWRVE